MMVNELAEGGLFKMRKWAKIKLLGAAFRTGSVRVYWKEIAPSRLKEGFV